MAALNVQFSGGTFPCHARRESGGAIVRIAARTRFRITIRCNCGLVGRHDTYDCYSLPPWPLLEENPTKSFFMSSHCAPVPSAGVIDVKVCVKPLQSTFLRIR